MGKRGPEPKPESELRKHPITCRVTDAELEKIDQGRPKGITRGEWLRKKALARRLPKPIPEINQQAWKDLSRLASNLNQLVRAIHQGHQGQAPEADINLTELYKRVQELRSELLGVEHHES